MSGDTPPNPYQAPVESEAVSEPLSPGPDAGCYRDGQYLMVRDATVLPDICPFSGVAGQSDEVPRWRPMSWSPQWVDWVIKFLPLVYPLYYLKFYDPSSPRISTGLIFGGTSIAISLISTYGREKSLTFKVGYPIAPSVARAFRRWTVAIVIRALVMIGLIIAACTNYQHPDKTVLTAILVILLIPAFPWRRRLRVVSHRDGWFRIKNCHPDFLAVLPTTEPVIPSAAPPSLEATGGSFCDGSYLFVQDGATLPGICPFTGVPVEAEWPARKLLLSFFPVWAYALLPAFHFRSITRCS